MRPFAWIYARSVAGAVELASTTVADAMSDGGAVEGGSEPAGVVLKAGGIDLLDLMKERLVTPAAVVSLGQMPELAAITEEATGRLRIGAMATLATICAHARVRQRYGALADAVRTSASPQIRHVATLGGNLLQRPRCWYFRAAEYPCLRKGGGHCFALSGENRYHAIFDNHPCAIVHPSTAATVLVALGASIEIVAAEGAARRIRLEDFLISSERDVRRENDLRPHELLTAILLPPLPKGVRMVHLKQSEKTSFDWPLADVAVVLDLSAEGICRGASIVLGAAAPIPHRAKSAELMLKGQRIADIQAGEAAHLALEGATPLTGNAYKLPLFEALVRRAILSVANPIHAPKV